VEFPVQPSGVGILSKLFGVRAGLNSFTNQLLPRPASFRLAIANGSGIATQAGVVASRMTAKGFRVASSGAVTPVGKVGETVVWYGGPPPPANGNWVSPALAAAQLVLAQLQGPVILGYDPAKVIAGSLVTIQIGTDLTVKSSVPAKTTSPTKKKGPTKSKKAPTTTVTTIYSPPGVSTNGSFSAPSTVNQALQPWDPRACNAAGTGPAVATTTAPG
jgi:hypothetical protein